MSTTSGQSDPAAGPSPAAQSHTPGDPDKRKDRRLGRGLASLISIPAAVSGPVGQVAASQAAVTPPGQGTGLDSPLGPVPIGGVSGHPHAMMMNLEVASIEPNPHQPRRHFDEGALAGLADSIRANGIVQPILVRRRPARPDEPTDGKRFQLIAGERRWRAAQAAGLAAVPAIIKSIEDDAMLELALIENIQRTDLDPIERAAAYKAILQRQNISQDILAQRLGESRANVGHYLRLLALPQEVQQMIAAGTLTFGHAKALMGLRLPTTQLRLARTAAAEGWPVRQLELTLARLASEPGGEAALEKVLAPPVAPAPAKVPPPRPANIIALEEKLTRRLGTRVIIKQGRRADMGKVVIDFYCLDDFDRVLDALGVMMD